MDKYVAIAIAAAGTACAGSCSRGPAFDDSELLPIAAIHAEDVVHVEALLEGEGIVASIEDGPVVHAVLVFPSDKSKAVSALRADAASEKYWIQFTEDQ